MGFSATLLILGSNITHAKKQPTAFRINAYELDTVFETPELISELSEYAWSRQPQGDRDTSDSFAPSGTVSEQEKEASILLLQILAAADYFTANQTLMETVSPVFVDIILDPYIFNVLPRSLLPTVGYIVVVAILSWFLARYLSDQIYLHATRPGQAKKDQ